MRPATASTIGPSASAPDRTVSSWRPPWLETTTPAAPWAMASSASSAVRIPLTRIGSSLSAAKRSMSDQLQVGVDLPVERRRRDLGRLRRVVARDVGHGVAQAHPPLALAKAEHRPVHGHHQGLVPAPRRVVDQLAGGAAVGEGVELEPARHLGDALGDARRPGAGERRHAHDGVGGRGRPGDGHLAVGVREPLKGRRGHDHRMGRRTPRSVTLGSQLARADEHPRPQRPAPPCGHVVGQRDLVAGPALDVAEGLGAHLRQRRALVLGERARRARTTCPGWCSSGAASMATPKATEIAGRARARQPKSPHFGGFSRNVKTPAISGNGLCRRGWNPL